MAEQQKTSNPNKIFFEPITQIIYGVTNITPDGKTQYLLFDDIAQLTVSTPVDTKPIMQLGNNEQQGYTFGQRLYAGTVQVPANSYPSFFRLFKEWLQLYNTQIGNVGSDVLYLQANAEDLPPFDMLVFSIPSTQPNNNFYAFTLLIKNVKFIETSIDLNTVSPQNQIIFYRFTQDRIVQKIVEVTVKDEQFEVNMDELLKTFGVEISYNKVSELIKSNILADIK